MKAEEAIMGAEPHFKVPPTTIEIVKTFNWYNYFYTTEDSKKWVLQWLKTKKVNIDNISKIPHDKFPLWTGVVCRQLLIGSSFPSEWTERISKKVVEFELLTLDNSSKQTKTIVPEKYNEKKETLIEHIEGLLDQFYNNQYKIFNHDLLNWLKEHSYPKKTVLEVSVKYLALNDELDANTNECEGYSRLSAKQYSDYKKFVKSIFMDIISYCEDKTVAAKPRKPRKKKEKSPNQLSKKVKYLSEFENIKSVDPSNIIGAQQVWFYNTKYKVLTKLECGSNAKLSVKGTTIINFDEKLSECKRLRKPDKVLSTVLNGGKVILKKIFTELKTKSVPPKGRLNEYSIILKVLK